ncbi:MAG: DNA polymerase III subunit beta [Bacilli bacterium]
MKLKIKKNLLLEELNKVSKALSSKNIIPVLAGIKFELFKDSLVLTASDNDISIQTTLKSNNKDLIIEKEGSIVIQGRYILDIVRKLPDEYINIEVIDSLKILIYTDNSEFNLNGINSNEYPDIDLNINNNFVSLEGIDIFNIVNQTCFATSNDESKPTLTGINLKLVGNIIECNSTDSYRLSRKFVEVNNDNIDDNFNIIIPSKNIIDFSKIIDEDDKINLYIFNNKVIFKTDNCIFQSRLINGSYPNTSNLIPTDPILTIKLNISEFYNSIDRASILANDKEKNIITLEIEQNKLTLRSTVAEIGRVEEKLNINNDVNETIKISFSSKYMMDALKAFSTENVDINFFGEVKPIILNSEEDKTLTELVLPIRTY